MFDTTKMINILITYGADVNAINKGNETALHIASENFLGDDILIELIRFNPKLEIKNLQGNTALHLARTKSKSEILIEAGADKEALNLKGETYLNRTKEPCSIL